MIYSDETIYNKLKQGVKPSILAQLNGCKVSDILDASTKFKRKLDAKDFKYNQIIKQSEYSKLKNSSKGSIMSGRYMYSEEEQEQMEEDILNSVSSKNSYSKIYESRASKPTYKSFLTKYSRLKKNISSGSKTKRSKGISSYTDRTDNHVQISSNADMIKSFEEEKQQYENKIKKIYDEAFNKSKKYMMKMAKIDIMIKRLK